MARQKIDWSKWDHLLGTLPDTELASKIGCTNVNVGYRRQELKIKPCSVRSKTLDLNWSQWESKLGTMPDTKLAILMGCSVRIVGLKRQKLHIPPYGHDKLPLHRINWAKWRHLLGTMTDNEMALLVGCSRHAVKASRERLGIRSFRMHGWSSEDQDLFDKSLMKCTGCSCVLPFDQFRKESRSKMLKRTRKCHECTRKLQRKGWFLKKLHYIKIMGGKCQSCGFSNFSSSLQFHHVTDDKKFSICSGMLYHCNAEKIMIELDKCCLLCSNCHDAFHGHDLNLEFIKISPIGWTVDSSEAKTSFPNTDPLEEMGHTPLRKEESNGILTKICNVNIS